MTNEWYYVDGSENQRGPIPKETLEIMFEDNLLHRSTLVWSSDLSTWTPATSVPALNWRGKPAYVPPQAPVAPPSYGTGGGYSAGSGYAPNPPVARSAPTVAPAQDYSDAGGIAKRLSELERVAGIVWVVVGILQILSGALGFWLYSGGRFS